MSFKAALSRNDTHRRNAEKKKKLLNEITPNTEEEKEHMSNW